MFLKYFDFPAHQTTLRQELLAGLTSFLATVYILFVNSSILSAAGIDTQAAFIATAIVTAIACILMGLFSNFPFVAAPGIPLASYFSFYVVQTLGYSWQVALGAVLISGIIFFILTATRIRGLILRSIPDTLMIGTAAGLGLFIALIGLKTAGVIVPTPSTLVKLGNLAEPSIILFFLGFFIIALLEQLKIPGAILIGIVSVTLLSFAIGLNHYHGMISLPSHLNTWNAFQLNGLFDQKGLIVIFTFVLITLFDGTGTLVGLLYQLRFKMPHVEKRISGALMADSVATVSGALLGTSSISVFCESAAGVRAGGRTGLTAILVGFLFIFAIFFAPLTNTVPAYATAPALLYVGILMIKPITEVQWDDLTEVIPGVATFILIPLSFSIADGLGIGIILYVILKALSGKLKQLKPLLIILAAFFLFHFALG
jgi:AGZA family xanthine/uracil permease-like MFS transporter